MRPCSLSSQQHGALQRQVDDRSLTEYTANQSTDAAYARQLALQKEEDHQLALELANEDGEQVNGHWQTQIGALADTAYARQLYDEEVQQMMRETRTSASDGDSSGGQDGEGAAIKAEAVDYFDDNATDEDRPEDADAAFDIPFRGADPVAESSQQAANRAAGRDSQELCIACHDDLGVAKTPCGHAYCADCLTGVLRIAVTDAGAFPPRCCRQEIQLADIRHHLEPAFAREFEQKALEITTDNPVYCYEPACAAFINPDTIRGGDAAVCRTCYRSTCVHCESQSHEGACQQNQAVQQLLDLAGAEEWRL